MKTINTSFLSSRLFYSILLAVVFVFSITLIFETIQGSDVQAYNQDNIILAMGPGNGGGGGGGGGNGGGGGGNGGGGGGEGGGGEGEEPVQGNNLSFPVIAADGYAITPLASSSFAVVFEGPYIDLSADELAILEGSTWYAQKTSGNVWQASFTAATSGEPVSVYGVDWGDNIESINPIVGNPFRIEVGLYNQPDVSMLGYKMALLANPSSPSEVQGTNGETYDSEFAAIVSNKPKLVIQDITNVCTTDIVWSGTAWTLDNANLDEDNVVFGPELNVGGKYIYGASQGGWRPKSDGMYRITMYMPDSDILLTGAVVGNYTDWVATATSTEGEDGGSAAPVVDATNNLTFVDVISVNGSGGRSPGDPGTDTYDPCAEVVDDDPATTTDPVATTTDPEVIKEDTSSKSSGGGGGISRKVVTEPIPSVAGTSTYKYITQSDIDAQKSLLTGRMKGVQLEYLKLLQLMLINRLVEMLSQLQSQLQSQL